MLGVLLPGWEAKRSRNPLGASTIVLFEPSGAACIPGGVCPCGLEAGAPPVPVSTGPVGPCGCVTPFMSGGSTVRPVLCGESPGCRPNCVCADALPAHNARHNAAIFSAQHASLLSPALSRVTRRRTGPVALASGAGSRRGCARSGAAGLGRGIVHRVGECPYNQDHRKGCCRDGSWAPSCTGTAAVIVWATIGHRQLLRCTVPRPTRVARRCSRQLTTLTCTKLVTG